MGNRRDEWLERAAVLPELRTRVAQHPLAAKAQGARIYDVDNVGYIDYLGAGGSVLLGYANQFILDAVRKVLAAGLPEGLHVPHEVELAEKLAKVLPWAETLWLFRHQDEALRRLLSWARRTTGRPTVMTLDGGAPLAAELPLGVPPAQPDPPFVEVPGWHIGRIESALAERSATVAALVVDPLMTGSGVVQAPQGTLPRIAAACERASVLLILDERVSGFRLHRAGGARWAGVEPDAAVYGGALGGGFPVGVVAFRQGVVAETGPESPVSPPHPVSLAASEAVLSILKNDSTYDRLEDRAAQLEEGIAALADRFERPLVVNRAGSVFSLYFSRTPVTDRAGALAADGREYRRFVGELRSEGVLLPQEPNLPAFVSSAHGGKDIDETLVAFERVLLRLHQEDLP